VGRFFGGFYTTSGLTSPDIYLWAEGEGEPLRKRALGCVLMCLMPDEGVDEAIRALRDVLEFWIERSVAPVLPPVEHRSAGRVVSTGSRPELVLGE
jgi:hypothetical protein